MKLPSLLLALLLLAACFASPEPTRTLFNAVDTGDLDQVKRHIEHGSDLNQAAVNGETAIHVAARKGRWNIAQLLLKNGADPKQVNAEGENALQIALLHRNVELAGLLVKRAGLLTPADTLMQQLIGAKLADQDALDFLLAQGASLSAADGQGNHPLHQAALLGDRRMVRLLVSRGADPNAVNAGQQRVLTLARQSGDKDVVDFLLSKGALE